MNESECTCVCVSCRYQTEFSLSLCTFSYFALNHCSCDSVYLIVFCFEFLGGCFWHECEIVFEKPESLLWIGNLVVCRQFNILGPLVIHHQ